MLYNRWMWRQNWAWNILWWEWPRLEEWGTIKYVWWGSSLRFFGDFGAKLFHQVVTAGECAKQCADEPQCHGWSHFAPAKRYLALFWFLFPFFLFSSSSAQILLMLIISHPPDVTSNLRWLAQWLSSPEQSLALSLARLLLKAKRKKCDKKVKTGKIKDLIIKLFLKFWYKIISWNREFWCPLKFVFLSSSICTDFKIFKLNCCWNSWFCWFCWGAWGKEPKADDRIHNASLPFASSHPFHITEKAFIHLVKKAGLSSQRMGCLSICAFVYFDLKSTKYLNDSWNFALI